MAKASSHVTNINLGEGAKIASIKKLRTEAITLRSEASGGSYGEDELRRFYTIIEAAEPTLVMSNVELGERVGLGSGYFGSVARAGRYPKLVNFLRALTSVIEVADERLVHVDALEVRNSASPTAIGYSRIEQDHAELRALAHSLSLMAREEIEKLEADLPNDSHRIAENKKQRELMALFADGFERIARQLSILSSDPHEPVLLGKAGEVVAEVGKQINNWWTTNAAEAIDWSIRLPIIIAAVGALGWAGANMTVGTTAVAAMVGGRKVLDVIKRRKKDE